MSTAKKAEFFEKFKFWLQSQENTEEAHRIWAWFEQCLEEEKAAIEKYINQTTASEQTLDFNTRAFVLGLAVGIEAGDYKKYLAKEVEKCVSGGQELK